MKIILGSGPTRYEGWQDTDLQEHWSPNKLDVRMASDFEKWPNIEMALAEHIWEHLTQMEGIIAAQNCYRFIPRIRVATPDGLFPDDDYVAKAILGECPGDHKSLYNWKTLSALFTSVGYKVTLLEWWDNGIFHYRPWDTEYGMIFRSVRYNSRNFGMIGYTSIILDAIR